MADYKISGVWKDNDGIITHYAFHTKTKNGHTLATKKTKSQAVSLVEDKENTTITWIWNYLHCIWAEGETVHVVDGANGKYLRSNPDNKLTDNLDNLIDFDWISR
jgi:hypothetical protein